jgi:hypothetical protein
MKKILLILIAIIILLAIIFYFLLFKNQKTETQEDIKQVTPEVKSIDYKAAFLIYTNGTKRIFSDSRYHNKSEEVFIESSNPNIINIRSENITWTDFFSTLPMKLDSDCLTTGTGQEFCNNTKHKLQFFVNGIKDPDALSKVINEGDKLLVTYDVEDPISINKQINSIPEVN